MKATKRDRTCQSLTVCTVHFPPLLSPYVPWFCTVAIDRQPLLNSHGLISTKFGPALTNYKYEYSSFLKFEPEILFIKKKRRVILTNWVRELEELCAATNWHCTLCWPSRGWGICVLMADLMPYNTPSSKLIDSYSTGYYRFKKKKSWGVRRHEWVQLIMHRGNKICFGDNN